MQISKITLNMFKQNDNRMNVVFDSMNILNEKGKKYQFPVLTKHCNHLTRGCFDYEELDNVSQIRCDYCGKSVGKPFDLIWDIRYYASKEFHESVSEIHIIKGILINKYCRKDRYLKFFFNDQIQDQFLKSYQKNEIFDYSLNSQNENIEFMVFCLLDNVQINIPVRIRGCTHLECYELTSLLYLQQNNWQNQQTFECNHPKCKQRLDISSLDTFFSQIYIDVQLLKVIKNSNRTSIKIKYNKETQSLDTKSQFSIRELFDKFQNKYSQQRIELDEVQCQTLEQLFFPVLQNSLIQEDEVLNQKLTKHYQSSQSIQMIDQITQLPFEIPTRCKYCTDLNKSLDLRTYIFDFFLKRKLNKNVYYYQCPLCKHSQQQTIQAVTLNKYIYIDSFLMKKMLNDQNVGEVQSLQNIEPFNSINFETFTLLNPLSKVRYKNPALTKFCTHRDRCFEKEEALQEIQNNTKYLCPNCNQQAKSSDDLVDDWRVGAYEEFNEHADDITIIKGMMVNKYTRNKNRYLNFYTKAEYLKQIEKMINKRNQDFSINSLIKKTLQHFNNQDHQILYWRFCLSDKVKIIFPVRILGCHHYQCYELTSLLFYQEQNRKNKEYFDCNYTGCLNRLRIAHKDYSKQENPNNPEIDEQEKILDIKTLFAGICVDQDLLTAIKQSNPSSCKFYFNQQTEKIQEDLKMVDGKFVDPFISKFYEQHPNLQSKIQYQEFQKLISEQTMYVSQGDLLYDYRQLSKKVALHKYRNYRVDMKDKFTQLTIEYPVRCKLCTNLEVCMDMRSYVAHFTFQKKMFPSKGYECPLCNQILSYQINKMNIQNQIYLDQNMLSYMYQDMSYANGTQILEYQGEKYLLQEFMDRQKIKRENYIASLTERRVLFKQLYCILNTDQRMKQPLFLLNCPDRNIVDFKSFYEELKKINFDYENQGLILCKCSYCNLNPIKSFVGNIYFHEAFYEAFGKFNNFQISSQLGSFSYKFETEEQNSKVIEQASEYDHI